MTGRTLLFIGVVLAVALTTGCRSKKDMNLKTVKVSSSAVYCLFDPSCTVTPTERSITPIPMQSAGTAYLESRTFEGKPGTPASGLHGYEYRLDLSKAVETKVQVEEVGELNYMPCLRTLLIEFGPIIDTLDYDGDGKAGDLAYAVASGGPGKVGIGTMERWSNNVFINFDSPICVGAANREGDSTFLLGLVSAKPPRSIEATIKETAGMGAASPKLKKNLKYKVMVHAPQIGG
jgi:hypothetical protein